MNIIDINVHDHVTTLMTVAEAVQTGNLSSLAHLDCETLRLYMGVLFNLTQAADLIRQLIQRTGVVVRDNDDGKEGYYARVTIDDNPGRRKLIILSRYYCEVSMTQSIDCVRWIYSKDIPGLALRLMALEPNAGKESFLIALRGER